MRPIKIVLPLIAALGFAAAMVSPASAAPNSLSQCTSGSFCAWSNSNYSGAFASDTQCSSAGYSKSLGAIGGGVSAKNNRSSGTVKLYSNGSFIATLGPGAQLSSLSTRASIMTCFS